MKVRFSPPSQSGFTFVELLIVVGISIVVLGGAITAFTDFADRREVVTAVDEIKTRFETAKSRAAAGDLGGCNRLVGYQIQSYEVNNTSQLTLQAVCGDGEADPAQTQILPSGVSVSPDLDMTFQVLNAGVQLPGGAASQDITVSQGDNSYVFTLHREGRVSEGAWE